MNSLQKLIILSGILLLPACASKLALPEEPVPSSTAAASEITISTSTISLPSETPFVTNTSTPTFKPSATTRPTGTPTPLLSPTPTELEYWVLLKTASATPESIEASSFSHTSPDGNWTVHTFSRTINMQITVTDKQGRITFIHNEDKHFWSDGAMVPFLWSKDGRYLFYCYSSSGDGLTFTNCAGMWRLELKTNKVLEIYQFGSYHPTSVGDMFLFDKRSMSISPDDTLLADIDWDGEQNLLTIQKIGTEEKRTIPINSSGVAGGIVWSPDQKKFVFTTCEGWNFSDAVCSLIEYDVETLTSRTVLPGEQRVIDVLSWSSDNVLIIWTRGESGTTLLDLTTGDTSIGPTLTPRPTPY